MQKITIKKYLIIYLLVGVWAFIIYKIPFCHYILGWIFFIVLSIYGILMSIPDRILLPTIYFLVIAEDLYFKLFIIEKRGDVVGNAWMLLFFIVNVLIITSTFYAAIFSSNNKEKKKRKSYLLIIAAVLIILFYYFVVYPL